MSEGVNAPGRNSLAFRFSIMIIIAAVLGVIYFEITDPKGELIEPAPSSSFISECA